MKKKLIFIWLLMLGTLTSCQSCSSEYKNVNEIIVEELEIPVPLGDPFILLHNGTYYAYGTHSDEGIEDEKQDITKNEDLPQNNE